MKLIIFCHHLCRFLYIPQFIHQPYRDDITHLNDIWPDPSQTHFYNCSALWIWHLKPFFLIAQTIFVFWNAPSSSSLFKALEKQNISPAPQIQVKKLHSNLIVLATNTLAERKLPCVVLHLPFSGILNL